MTDMAYMFYRTTSFTQTLGWCVASNVDIYLAFSGTGCAAGTDCGVTVGGC